MAAVQRVRARRRAVLRTAAAVPPCPGARAARCPPRHNPSPAPPRPAAPRGRSTCARNGHQYTGAADFRRLHAELRASGTMGLALVRVRAAPAQRACLHSTLERACGRAPACIHNKPWRSAARLPRPRATRLALPQDAGGHPVAFLEWRRRGADIATCFVGIDYAHPAARACAVYYNLMYDVRRRARAASLRMRACAHTSTAGAGPWQLCLFCAALCACARRGRRPCSLQPLTSPHHPGAARRARHRGAGRAPRRHWLRPPRRQAVDGLCAAPRQARARPRPPLRVHGKSAWQKPHLARGAGVHLPLTPTARPARRAPRSLYVRCHSPLQRAVFAVAAKALFNPHATLHDP